MLDNISLAVAFSAGILSFFSPCIIPLLPVYFSYLGASAAGGEEEGKKRVFLVGRAVLFIFGFSLIFIVLGMLSGSLGFLLLQYRSLLNRIGGLLIIFFGLYVAGIVRPSLLNREKKWHLQPRAPGALASFLMGMAFAAGWTPCIGPVLASILIYAGSQATLFKGMVLLAFYSLGLAVPFILTALAMGTVLQLLRRSSRYLPIISFISGIILVIMGLLVFNGRLLYG
ncbi:MAG: cytochrome c biogenesis protein CcdA [Moorella sp. (in: firmicutes)]